MNVPPNIDPVAAHSDSDVMHWLTNDTRDERFIDNIFAELCVRLQRAGIPVKRASLHVLIYHPQWLLSNQSPAHSNSASELPKNLKKDWQSAAKGAVLLEIPEHYIAHIYRLAH